jgi:hypothetical protein
VFVGAGGGPSAVASPAAPPALPSLSSAPHQPEDQVSSAEILE